jgi:hypothetical protein
LSFGFALTHCGETRRNEWAKAHFSFGAGCRVAFLQLV